MRYWVLWVLLASCAPCAAARLFFNVAAVTFSCGTHVFGFQFRHLSVGKGKWHDAQRTSSEWPVRQETLQARIVAPMTEDHQASAQAIQLASLSCLHNTV